MKKSLSLLLVVVLLFTMLPLQALALETDPVPENNEETGLPQEQLIQGQEEISGKPEETPQDSVSGNSQGMGTPAEGPVMAVDAALEAGALPIDIGDANLLKVTQLEDFEQGSLTNLEIVQDIGNGALRLESGKNEGTFVSAVYQTTPFQYMVASWNSDTPEGTTVEIQARVHIQGTEDGAWTDWLSWGVWSPYILRGSADDVDSRNRAETSTDELIVTGADNRADLVQLKAILTRESGAEAPVLRQMAATIQNVGADRIEATYAEEKIAIKDEVEMLSTPAYSQMVRDPAIGDSICSPSTMTILLNDRDHDLDLLPEEMALNVYDFNYGFGNWAFTVAGGGMYGYEAYVQYADFDLIDQELSKGNSVGISVRYRNHITPSSNNPYLENGAAYDTSGHLITLTGYTTEDGKKYYFSSDTATSNEAATAGDVRKYEQSQLDAAWGTNGKKVAYIIPNQAPEENAGGYAVNRVQAELKSLPDRANEFALTANGSVVSLPEDFTKGKMTYSGRGTLAFTVESFATQMPEGVTQMTANNTFFYADISVSPDGNLILPMDYIYHKLGVDLFETKEVTVYAVFNDGTMYIAKQNIRNAPAVIPAPLMDGSQDVAPNDYYVGAESGNGAATQMKVTAGGVQQYTHGGKLGFWVGAGIRMPEGLQPDQIRIYSGSIPSAGKPAAPVTPDQIYELSTGEQYVLFYADAGSDQPERFVTIDWDGDGTRYAPTSYQFNLDEVIRSNQAIAADNNAVVLSAKADFAQGSLLQGTQLLDLGGGSVTLSRGTQEGVYLSPVYQTPVYEWLIANWNAVTPGSSSVEVQARVYAMRSETWTGWMSFGKWGTGVCNSSGTYTENDAELSTDSLTLFGGSSTTANSNAFQLRVILRGDGNNMPILYQLGASYKKTMASNEAAGPTTGSYIGETIPKEELPEEVDLGVKAYSTYSHDSGLRGWKYANSMFMAMNAMGADALYPEVALSCIDFTDGINNWAYNPSVAGKFGMTSYVQYDATPDLIQQVLAHGNLVVLNVNAGVVGATNSNASHAIVIQGYKITEQGVVFQCICPSGDVSELNAGDVFFDCSADTLQNGITKFGSSAARGLMYVIGDPAPDMAQYAFKRTAATLSKTADREYKLYVGSKRIVLPADFTGNLSGDFGHGTIEYSMDDENKPAQKLADRTYSTTITVNASGNLVIPQALQDDINSGRTATVYVMTSDGITYQAKLKKAAPYFPPTGSGSTTDSNSGAAGTEPVTQVTVEGKSQVTGDVTTLIPDQTKLANGIAQATEGATVTVPVSASTSAAAVQLPMSRLAEMAQKNMILAVQTETADYALPVSALDLGAVTDQLGSDDAAKISVTVTIAKVDPQAAAQAAAAGGFEIVGSPLSFAVTAGLGGKSVSIERFGQMVARVIELTPQQAAQATTAVILEADGSVRPVPTRIYEQDGKHYAEINSMTNSTYVLISNQQNFADAEGKWYADAASEMASRKIVNGIDGSFAGELAITRAEFAAMIVRALGLPAGQADFDDVSGDDWCYGAVGAAAECGIVNGKGENRFEPNAKITRQEAMVMISRAAKLIGYQGDASASAGFTDLDQVADWAMDGVTFNTANGLIRGSDGQIHPNANITRAETAAVLLRFLQNAGLVDVRGTI